ncbi:MAG: D-alanine--D-alanine ligase [Eubacteriaceae bacterium]|nr:D-alanine--D-alanine ligase [Eubacteriaceae bacterium]
MDKKRNVGIIFGGKSGEHEVSLNSAYNVMKAIDRDKFDITPVGITKDGKWIVYDGDIENIKDGTWIDHVTMPSTNLEILAGGKLDEIDVFFPVLHGTFGEDGTIQGLFDIMNVPYVGCGVLASSVAMDKVATKEICKAAGVGTGEYAMLRKSEVLEDMDKCVNLIELCFDYPVFVKPANMGSSVGISKATDKASLKEAIEEAIKYDTKLIIEAFIAGREVEVAVLGNEDAQASVVGEVIPCNEFYDYEAKYLSGDSSVVIIPADISEELSERVRRMAVKAYNAICGSGLARVDFFIEDGGNILLNEINTLPGFTNISMYPKLWQATGIEYTDLITKLIDLAYERYDARKELIYSKESK